MDINRKNIPSVNSEQGFSLLEAMVSLLILFAMMAGLLPVFMTWRLNTVNNRIKTGAIAISQQVLDQLRQNANNVADWATDGTETDTFEYEGREYTTQITYCNDDSRCSNTSRQVQLEVIYNNDTVYTIETVYASFDEGV